MSRFIPFVLNDQVEADGEKAFLLAAYSLEPGDPDITLPVAPLPFRSSRMKAQLLWQVEEIKFGLLVIVRTPFGNQKITNGATETSVAGAFQAAPSITLTPFGNYDADMNYTVFWSDSQDPNAANGVEWANFGALTPPAPGFFNTFNSKPIPNWAFLINNSGIQEGSAVQMLIDIDFSHSIT